MVNQCRDRKFVETITGRRRYFPRIDSTNRNQRASDERAAANTIAQGSIADIVKTAMLRIDEVVLKKHIGQRDGPRLLVMIHDEVRVKHTQYGVD